MKKPEKKRYNFFERIYVSTTNFEDNKAEWSFNSTGIIIMNLSSTGRVVEYSFDGITVDGDLDPDKINAGMVFDNRKECCIYFRLMTPGTAALIRIETWA